MGNQKTIEIRNVKMGNSEPFVFIAGPCQIESRDHCMRIAERLKKSTDRLGISFIFKSSYDKANRTSLDGPRGIGLDKGLEILMEIRDIFECPVLTDVHTVDEAKIVGKVIDIIQIPALLSRQTDLLIAAGLSSAAVNIKKGQFLSPWDMEHAATKVLSQGNERVILCERGASFGYNTLITDFRSLPIMAQSGLPVMFDATHSVQQPGGLGNSSGGSREYAPILARAAVAVGVAAVFAETHDNPNEAPSDGACMLPLSWIDDLLRDLKSIDSIIKNSSAEYL